LEKENANIKSTLELSRSQLSKDVVALKNKIDENNTKIKELEKELAAKNKELDLLAQEKEWAVAQVKGTYDSLVTELKHEIKQGEILKGVTGRQIKVEGHTDNVPISSRLAERFPTNWELSTVRATMVVRYLQGRGVNPGVLSAEGYAEFHPVSPNDTEEGKAANRRIEIVLVPLEANK